MISFSCPQCGMKFQVKPEFAGRSSRCPSCKQMLVVPQPVKTAVLAQGHIDGTPSSLDRAGTDSAVTLENAGTAPPASRQSVRDLLARRNNRAQRYVVESEIARGGMGAVLRAVDCDIRREVAVKYLLDQADPKKKLRFIEEAQITGQLEHPNIVPIHELGVDAQQRLFFTMKMVKGRSLAQVLDELRQNPKRAEKEYSLTRLLNILVGVCNALAYAHSCGVVHRDLKPANIMLGDFGEVYVMDWGLAKVRGSDAPAAPMASMVGQAVAPAPSAVPLNSTTSVTTSRNSKVVTGPEADLTQDGAVLGTPAYMPPEQATGKLSDIDQRSDIYSLGAILYEMLALQPPVDKNGNYLEVLVRVSQGEILPPEERAPARARAGKIPRELAAVAMKALAKDRDKRYPTVAALRRDIERFQEGRSVSAKEDSAVEMCWKLVKRNKGASLAAAAALVVLVCSLGFSFRAWLHGERAHAAYVKEQEEKRAQIQRSVPAFVEAARLSVERRKYDNALAQVNVALDADPENAEARLLKGQVQIVRGEFAAAEGELREYLRLKPSDAQARKLADLCPKARPGDAGSLLALAQVFNQQQAPALADGLLTKFMGQNSSEARKQLFDVYKKRLEAAWPGSTNWFNMDPNGLFELRLFNSDLTRLDPLQGMPLTKLSLDGCTQLQDLTPLKGMQLASLSLHHTQVRDLAPLQGMALTSLNLTRCEQISDLSPLRGLPLTTLSLNRCSKVRDLTPLKGLPLESLNLGVCPVSDLTPLHGMPLKMLDVGECGQVRDLTPLQGMKLTSLNLSFSQVQDLTPLRGMPLERLNILFCGQIRDLKPLEGMPLTHLSMHNCTQVRDLAPLRGMKFTEFDMRGCSQVRDLTPLQGMSFTSLDLMGCGQVRDLTPLRGMPLTSLRLENCGQVFDLTPLQGMKLAHLNVSGCGLIKDLSPLRGMPLTSLNLSHCSQVRDLTPLHDMPLSTLHMTNVTPAVDLTPLQGMKLTTLDLRDSGPMLDLTPLAATTLAELSFTPRNVSKGLDAIRQMKTLKTVSPGDGRRLAVDDFWKRYDTGEFKK
jgi:serine/threonine protein kinase/Leucine-rich repeat (LRR) protein